MFVIQLYVTVFAICRGSTASHWQYTGFAAYRTIHSAFHFGLNQLLSMLNDCWFEDQKILQNHIYDTIDWATVYHWMLIILMQLLLHVHTSILWSFEGIVSLLDFFFNFGMCISQIILKCSMDLMILPNRSFWKRNYSLKSHSYCLQSFNTFSWLTLCILFNLSSSMTFLVSRPSDFFVSSEIFVYVTYIFY